MVATTRSLFESLIFAEAFYYFLGSLLNKRDKRVDDRVRDILKQSDVCGKCTVFLIDIEGLQLSPDGTISAFQAESCGI